MGTTKKPLLLWCYPAASYPILNVIEYIVSESCFCNEDILQNKEDAVATQIGPQQTGFSKPASAEVHQGNPSLHLPNN